MDFVFVGERLVVDLLNTVTAQDLLRSGEDVAAWAATAGVPLRVTRPHDSVGLARAPAGLRALREGLRRGLVAWAAEVTPGRELVALVNRQLARDPEITEVEVRRGKAVPRRRSRAGAVARLHGAVARSAAELLASGDPRRLRKCANPACPLMFYDVSKAGRRRWCSMQTCGARAKVRAFRARRGSSV